MKDKIIFLILTLFLIPSIAISQDLPKDSLFGNVKKIRAKVIFLTEIENPQLIYDDDYGHSGFRGPESTITIFYDFWYSTNSCYYLNYERYFNKNRKIIKDTWFGKKNDFMKSYRYIYDKKERLISTIDSSEYYIDTRNHYFEEYGEYIDENIIFENIKLNIFSHNYRKYKNGKVIRSKNFDENGTVDEYINHYNDNGKLAYRIYKNPNNWKKLEDNSSSYGVQDSIGVTYKNLINEYDKNNRLIKTQIFDLYSDENRKNPVEASQITFNYDGNNLITKTTSSKVVRYETYFNYRYDKYNRLVEKYCCDKDISKAKMIQKYTYKNDKIAKLNYKEESFEPQKMVNYNIFYSYKYDNNKNWIEILKTVDGVALYKWVREIEYY
jgi:hypothetical protein